MLEAPAPAADTLGESSDPVRLYLKEMGNFQLLSREQEVEIAKRIEAGENEVEEEVLGSPIMLDFVIRVGERVEAGEADLRDVFEDAAETPDDPDEERGPEADERAAQEAESRDQEADRPARQDRAIGGRTPQQARPAAQAQARQGPGALQRAREKRIARDGIVAAPDAGAPAAGRGDAGARGYRVPVLPGDDDSDRRGHVRAAGRDPGAVPGDRDQASETRLPCLPGHRGSSAGTSPIDRRRPPNRGDGRACAGGPLC